MMHRILPLATVLFAMCVQACTASCPQETTEPTEPAHDNPCAGFAAAGVDYHDGHGALVPAGESVMIPVGGVLTQSLTFLPGEMLGELRVRIAPATHESFAGMAFPTVDVRKSTPPSSVVGSAADPYAVRATHSDDYMVASEYASPHEIIAPLTERVVDDSAYVITIGGEAGPGAQALVVCGTQVSTSD